MMFIILLFFPLIFFEKAFINNAGALRFVFKWLSQLLTVKFSNLSFSNREALFTKQSKYLSLDLENLIILLISFFGYGEFKDYQKQKVSNLFYSTIINYEESKKERNIKKLIEIILAIAKAYD